MQKESAEFPGGDLRAAGVSLLFVRHRGRNVGWWPNLEFEHCPTWTRRDSSAGRWQNGLSWNGKTGDGQRQIVSFRTEKDCRSPEAALAADKRSASRGKPTA